MYKRQKIDLVKANGYEVRSGAVRTVYRFEETDYFMKGKKLSESMKERLLKERSFSVLFGSKKYVFECTDHFECSLFLSDVLQERIVVDEKLRRFEVYDAFLMCEQHGGNLCPSCSVKEKSFNKNGKKCENLQRAWFKKEFTGK